MHDLTCAAVDPLLELLHQSESPAKSKNVLSHMEVLMKQELQNDRKRYKPEYQQPQDPQPPF